ncbi:MAG: hypothetical protein WC152_08095, partial [Candidatus Izemoplasmatales bacterium]
MFSIYITSKYKDLKHKNIQEEINETPDSMIEIDESLKYQQIMGFGGAFTEAACYTISRLSKKNQLLLLNAYYNKED